MDKNISEKSLYLKCDCYGETLEIQYYDYEKGHNNDKGFNVSLWRMSRDSHKMSWLQRFRWCWRILRTGDPWNDYIILNKEKAKQVSEYINKYL